MISYSLLRDVLSVRGEFDDFIVAHVNIGSAAA